MSNRICEADLVLPSLLIMVERGGSITTSELIMELRQVMQPSGEDLDPLPRRKDDKFSQKVRNLRSHHTFERLGYARYAKTVGGIVSISPKGRDYVERYLAHAHGVAIPSNGFKEAAATAGKAHT